MGEKVGVYQKEDRQGGAMIKVKAPRYRDRTVLLARYRLPAGQGVDERY